MREMETHDELPCWPAPERNKEPILAVLRRVAPTGGRVLEVASGTGQHLVHFARSFSGLRWQPSDFDPEHCKVIDRRVRASGLDNVEPALELNAAQDPWTLAGEVEMLYNANMIHISPREVGVGLLRGASGHLSAEGVLVTYGPYLEGERSVPSNLRFDASLRARDSRWGVWELDAFEAQANTFGLQLCERVEMPANNLALIWRRRS